MQESTTTPRRSFLNLVKDEAVLEKRVFPLFPFSSLFFKVDKAGHIFEVKDISHTGMQIEIKDGNAPSVSLQSFVQKPLPL